MKEILSNWCADMLKFGSGSHLCIMVLCDAVSVCSCNVKTVDDITVIQCGLT